MFYQNQNPLACLMPGSAIEAANGVVHEIFTNGSINEDSPTPYNISVGLSRGIIPNECKMCIIISVFKAGIKVVLKATYRPISLLNHFFKFWNISCVSQSNWSFIKLYTFQIVSLIFSM